MIENIADVWWGSAFIPSKGFQTKDRNNEHEEDKSFLLISPEVGLWSKKGLWNVSLKQWTEFYLAPRLGLPGAMHQRQMKHLYILPIFQKDSCWMAFSPFLYTSGSQIRNNRLNWMTSSCLLCLWHHNHGFKWCCWIASTGWT